MKLGGKPVLECLGMNFALFISKGRRRISNIGWFKGKVRPREQQCDGQNKHRRQN